MADFIRPLASCYQSIHPRELVDNGEIEQTAVGTGPMILDEAITSERVTYVTNPDFWEKPVLVDGIEFRHLPDSAGRLAAFRAGQVATGEGIVGNLREVENLLETNPETQINLTALTNGTGFAMNLANPKYMDERVRQAISLAIDRDLLMAILYQGLGQVLHGIPWLFVWDEQPTVENGNLGPWTRFDPAESKKLLAAAGAEGLEMENIFFPYSSAYEQTPDILTDMFADVGITMTGGAADYTEFNSQWVGRQLKDVSTAGWGTIGFDAENYFYNSMHSTAPGTAGGSTTRRSTSSPRRSRWSSTRTPARRSSRRSGRTSWRRPTARSSAVAPASMSTSRGCAASASAVRSPRRTSTRTGATSSPTAGSTSSRSPFGDSGTHAGAGQLAGSLLVSPSNGPPRRFEAH